MDDFQFPGIAFCKGFFFEVKHVKLQGCKKSGQKKKGSFGIPLLSKCFFILVGDDWTPGGYMQDLKMNAWKMIHFLGPAYFQGLCLLVAGLPGLISETGFDTPKCRMSETCKVHVLNGGLFFFEASFFAGGFLVSFSEPPNYWRFECFFQMVQIEVPREIPGVPAANPALNDGHPWGSRGKSTVKDWPCYRSFFEFFTPAPRW